MKATIPPPLLTLLAGVLMWLLAGWAPSLDFIFPYGGILFWIVLCIGLALLVAGARTIFKHKTTIHPDKRSLSQVTALVTSGVYRYTRNPIYLGMALLLIAWWVFLANWLALVGPVAFIVFITRNQIKPEEVALEKIFGETYQHYKRNVRRWV